MKLTVSPAMAGDVAIIAEFNAAMARETEGLELDRARLSQGVRAVLENPALGRYFLARDDQRVVGQAMVTTEWSDWRNGDFWWFQSVYVREEARRSGVFAALFRHIEEEARRRPEICGLRLYVDAHNERAMEVYRRLGMVLSNYRVMETDFTIRRGEDQHAQER